MLKIQLLIKLLLYAMQSRICPPPPLYTRTHFPKCWGASALLRPWFQCSVFKKNESICTVYFGAFKWVLIGIGSGSRVKSWRLLEHENL
jgi:hypothetical protein